MKKSIIGTFIAVLLLTSVVYLSSNAMATEDITMLTLTPQQLYDNQDDLIGYKFHTVLTIEVIDSDTIKSDELDPDDLMYDFVLNFTDTSSLDSLKPGDIVEVTGEIEEVLFLGSSLENCQVLSSGSDAEAVLAQIMEDEEAEQKAVEAATGAGVLSSSDEPIDDSSSSKGYELADASIEEGVIYEGNGVSISVTGCSKASGWLGDSLNIGIYIENNSSLNLGFNAHSYAVNGIMTRNNIYDMDCDVAAGKKTNTTLELSQDVLELYGIEKVKYIDVLFWAYDNDQMYKSFETEPVRIVTNLNDDTVTRFNGNRLLDENGIQIDYLGKKDNDYWFSITNNTGSYFDFDMANLSVNDYTSSDVNYDLYGSQVLNGCQYVFNLDLSDDFLKLNNITDISKIEFSLTYRPMGDYFNEKSTSMVEVLVEQMTGTPEPQEEATSDVPTAEIDVSNPEIVKKVQQALNDAGYDCGTPDGKAGPKTAEAVTRYQTDKGLDVTGTIDQALVSALGIN